jgi:predicted ATP-grasp superfamily ATP-dependent carboligase
MGFTGVAEVEYKWDASDREYKLIEVNPRPWDQHRLGAACGTDLIHLAYCDHAGLPSPPIRNDGVSRKWIAEDVFAMTALRLVWRQERGLGRLFRQAAGKRIYGVWAVRDPLPFLYFLATFAPSLVRMGLRFLGRSIDALLAARQKTMNPALPVPPGVHRGS